jgi:formiminoglutamase
VVLGGGHETAYGSYLGLRRAFPAERIGIINFDAHFDLRNLGEAGASSGTPFNQIRRDDAEGFDYLCLGVAPESNTVALFRRAKDWGVRFVTDTALIQNADAGAEQIAALCARVDVVYLTIDIDVLPHYQAPGVSAPAARGVPLPTIERLVGEVRRQSEVYGCLLPVADIVEVSPPHDRDGMTSKTAALLALQLLSG